MTPEKELELRGRMALKLNGLGVNAKYVRTEIGPVVTTFYFILPFDMPIAKIMKKEEDIAVSCGVESVLITRKGGEIAIALPNPERSVVTFDRCLFSLRESKKKYALPIMLGTDTLGVPQFIDLYDQPHLLIAGATGSGKSVLLSSILGGLVCTKSPKELRLILIDTKKLDLTLFAGMPHLTDMVEDVKGFHLSFDRLMGMVRKRTEKMKGLARNIKEYNQINRDSPMPYYVVIIDEMADLIDEDKALSLVDDEIYEKQRVQQRIKSLVQICRATGVHLIAATQRPSVKIITGDIKVNLPTRIALRVPNRADALTIHNRAGAEHLLGKGDMLLESATENQVRYHGAYVSNEDIVTILDNADTIRQQLELEQEVSK